MKNGGWLISLLIGVIGMLVGAAAAGIPLQISIGSRVSALEVKTDRAIQDIQGLERAIRGNTK